jgi:hypothetical protein
MQPTWRRVGAGTGALFLIILAFLAGRVRAGSDPALRAAQPASVPAQVAPAESAEPAESESDQPETSVEPPVTRAS